MSMSLERNTDMETTHMNDFWGGVVSYAASGFALLTSHGNDILTIGGAVLLIARLVIEVPKAVKAAKGLFKKKD